MAPAGLASTGAGLTALHRHQHPIHYLSSSTAAQRSPHYLDGKLFHVLLVCRGQEQIYMHGPIHDHFQQNIRRTANEAEALPHVSAYWQGQVWQ